MPSSKKEEEVVYDNTEDYNIDIEFYDYDEDNNIFIYPENFAILTDPYQVSWKNSDIVYNTSVEMYDSILDILQTSGAPMLERVTFTDFFLFICRCSYKEL